MLAELWSSAPLVTRYSLLAEKLLLSLKVCDPACGSAHFLVGAAHRMAKRLAAVRTGDDEPAPEAVRTALRDVIGHCLYGVDLNPMAVELAKVALWMEALEPGKPLSFLDHRFKCGNSLLGATPALLAGGIPDSAFKAITGDDKAVCTKWRKANKKEREVRTRNLFDYHERQPWERLGDLATAMAELESADDDSLDGQRAKAEAYERHVKSAAYENSRLWADAWCAAFVWKKSDEFLSPITEDVFRRIEANPHDLNHEVRAEIRRLAGDYGFFHWHLEFPDVFGAPVNGEPEEGEVTGWSGGFDVVLGNPPWERIKLQEKEFFAERMPEIADAPNAAKRRKMIAALETEDPTLFGIFQEAKRKAEGDSTLVRHSGRYPLCGRGDVNTYSVFAELKRTLIAPTGRVGCLVPTGIATDDTTKFFFRDLMETRSLASLFDFENAKPLFPGVHRSYKFCLLTMAGAKSGLEEAEFAFFLHEAVDLRDEGRRFPLSAEDIALINPNTRTCPIFRSRRDAEITKDVYRRVPVLVKEGDPEGNPWGIKFTAMFHMANDSGLFRTRVELEEEGWVLEGNVFVRDRGEGASGERRAASEGAARYLPLYEAKMVHHFDHRWASYEGAKARDLTAEEKTDPARLPLPRYWVVETEVKRETPSEWGNRWFLGWRDICRNNDERTVIANVLPVSAVGHKFPLFITETDLKPLLPAICSFPFDYCTRNKYGSTSLTYFVLKQLPVLPPSVFSCECQWADFDTMSQWLGLRVLELTYTAWDLEAFARDCGYDGPPFRWDDERRFLLRCELDAAFFHLYLGGGEWRAASRAEGCQADETPEQLAKLKAYFPTPRDAVDYILETFPIVKRKDIRKHGDYRTKLQILRIYDKMQEAIDSGTPYKTLLDPPPADPRCAHSESTRPEWAKKELKREQL